MRAAFVLVLLLAIIAISESSLLNYFGTMVSGLLRADIVDIINCIIHNDIIIADLNVIIDAILKKDFNAVIVALSQVVMSLKDEITKCINDP
jgi:hypothetical protein